MRSLEWYMYSPSPFTLAYWIILTLVGYYKLRGRVKYKRWINCMSDSAFILGFTVLIGDLVWCFCCLFKFGVLFPADVPSLIVCLVRDMLLILFSYSMIHEYFNWKIIGLQQKFVNAFFWNLLFMVLWFGSAPSPAYTDWTFAYRYGLPLTLVNFSFVMSHVIGKSLSALMWWKFWR